MRIHQNGVSTPLRRGVFMKHRKVVCSKRLQSLRYEPKVSCSNRLKSPRAKTLGEKRVFCKDIEIKKGFRTRRKPYRMYKTLKVEALIHFCTTSIRVRTTRFGTIFILFLRFFFLGGKVFDVVSHILHLFAKFLRRDECEFHLLHF